MKYLINFWKQKAPKAGTEMPEYYRRALEASEVILAVYFLICFFLYGLTLDHWPWLPIGLYLLLAGCIQTNGRINVRLSLYGYALIVAALCLWHTYTIGWGCGAQHFLIPVLLLCFFNIYDPPWLKVLICLLLILCRMGLYAWSLYHPAQYDLSPAVGIAFQVINSLTLFLTLSVNCILLSSSIQDTERQLRLDNQELHEEASTDPLTQLPNRRAMMDVVEKFRLTEPEENFCIAIADIDFFKKVNDTYGHNCGDYTLQQLAALLKRYAGDQFQVCRWGGEEFCFFMPHLNLDQAGEVMFTINQEVAKMPLCFEGVCFSITVTIGVAENDFQSPMKEILETADRRLYRGKVGGRNQVVL